MTSLERYGRIILAIAVLALFFVIVGSMVAGEFQLTLLMLVTVVGAAGWVMMQAGRR